MRRRIGAEEVRLRTGVIGVFLLSGSTTLVEAKCIRVRIELFGQIVGTLAEDQRITVSTTPDASEKAGEPIFTGHQFTLLQLFDPTEGYSPEAGHDCSREPESVAVSLVRGALIQQRHVLDVKGNFKAHRNGSRLVLNKALVLAAGGTGTSTPSPKTGSERLDASID
jgi:hypothetical protein